MAGLNYITPRGIARLQRELSWLQRQERPQVVQEVSDAAALGDRSENAEYIYGKKRLREIDRRMRWLMKRMERVQVIDPAQMSGPVIRFGATVLVEDAEGRQQRWRIYGEDEVDVDAGVLSWRSPLARAVMGREEGDAVRFRTPGGTRELEILEVRYEPCPAEPEGSTSPSRM